MFSKMDQLEQQSDAWQAVFSLLKMHNPNLLKPGHTGKESVLAELQRIFSELDMAHQAEANALRNRDVAIEENELLKQKILRYKILLNSCY